MVLPHRQITTDIISVANECLASFRTGKTVFANNKTGVLVAIEASSFNNCSNFGARGREREIIKFK